MQVYEDGIASGNSIRISDWINDQPDSVEQYECIEPEYSKSLRHIVQQHRLGTSRALRSISGNRPAMPPANQGKSDSRKRSRSISYDHNVNDQHTPQKQRMIAPVYEDADTPRAVATSNITKGPILANLSSLPEKELEPSDSTSHISKASSTADSRAGSPTKSNLAAFRLADIQVDLPWIRSEADVPEDLRTLYEDIEAISWTEALIPHEVLELATTVGRIRPSAVLSEDADQKRKDACKYGGLEPERCFGKIAKIYEKAIVLAHDKAPEANWNTEVHSRILDLVIWELRRATSVNYCQITHIRITDKTLIPKKAGAALKSKMVDFALLIDGSYSPFENKIITFLKHRGLSSINQSDHECVFVRPLAINIETKTSNGAEAQAHVQLQTWVTAHFQQLRRLAPQATSFRSLPVIVIQGHSWLVMFAEIKPPFDRINVWRELELGTTRSIEKIYHLVASLQRLVRWIEEDYKPWFERVVLEGLSQMETSE